VIELRSSFPPWTSGNVAKASARIRWPCHALTSGSSPSYLIR
jgi:hypothetical protein